MLTQTQSIVAAMLYLTGSIKFGAFKLKLHEKDPLAPLSPFFINIRNKDNPTKPGTLEESDYDLIAKCLLEVINESGLEFDAIAGIPRAGDPIVEAIERLIINSPFPHPAKFRIIKLAKEEAMGIRRIIPLSGFNYKQGERILLVDDLVTKADTKIEAIRAIESSGSVVVGLVVLVDRQQGGREQIESAGYKLFSALTISELLDYYVQKEMIDNAKHKEALFYISTV